MCPMLSYQNIATLTPVYLNQIIFLAKSEIIQIEIGRLTRPPLESWKWNELFDEIIRSYVDKYGLYIACRRTAISGLLGSYHGRPQGVARVGHPPPLENGEIFFTIWAVFSLLFSPDGGPFSPYPYGGHFPTFLSMWGLFLVLMGSLLMKLINEILSI